MYVLAAVLFVGKVNPETLEVTLYDPEVLLEDPTYSHDFTLVGMADTSFLMLFHNTDQRIDKDYGYGTLQAKLATVDTASGTVAVGNTTELPNSTPIFSLAATRLSDSYAVVAYADYASNFAIRALPVRVGAINGDSGIGECTSMIHMLPLLLVGVLAVAIFVLITSQPIILTASCRPVFLLATAFGVSWQVSASDAATVVSSGMMDLDIATICEEEGRVMVAYSDAANKGAMTAVVGQVRGPLLAALWVTLRPQ